MITLTQKNIYYGGDSVLLTSKEGEGNCSQGICNNNNDNNKNNKEIGKFKNNQISNRGYHKEDIFISIAIELHNKVKEDINPINGNDCDFEDAEKEKEKEHVSIGLILPVIRVNAEIKEEENGHNKV